MIWPRNSAKDAKRLRPSVSLCLPAAGVWLLPVVVLFPCLFGPAQHLFGYGAVGRWVREIEFTFRDAETQWMVFACLGVYFVTFMVLEGRPAERLGAHGVTRPSLGLKKGDPWLVAGMLIGTLAYGFSYPAASKSTDALVWLAGVTLGKGASVWAAWGEVGRSTRCAPGGGPGAGRTTRLRAVVVVLTVLLLLAGLWQAKEWQRFQYRGQARWSGPWENPNIFGLLMGVGLVLAVGRGLHLKLNMEPPTSNLQHRTWKRAVWRWTKAGFFLAAAGVMAVGLVKSYSRGAWVAAVTGLGYLAWRWRYVLECADLSAPSTPAQPTMDKPTLVAASPAPDKSCDKSQHSKRKRWLVPILIVIASLAVIAFWNYRHTEQPIARRVFSVGNPNDFSWRNRVAAWEGALEMMAERPWFGFGWNQPERVYDQYYRASKVAESAAIQLNDYLMLGAALGIPALVCFAAYIGLSLRRNSDGRTWSGQCPSRTSPRPSPHGGEGDCSPVTGHLSRSAICRAGAIVLLVGFWFDGGLFKLATGATFWILLELGKEE